MTTIKSLKSIVLLLVCTALTLAICYPFYNWQRADLLVIGPVKMGDGIGRQAVELMDALYDSCSIGFIPTNKPTLVDIPERIQPIVDRSKNKRGKVVIYEETLPTPNQKFYRRLNKTLKGPKKEKEIRFAYSVIESTRIPPLWAKGFNTYFDALIVPDPWLVEVYQNSGVEIPIFVLPLGLNLEPFLQVPLKEGPHQPFCFINLSSMIGRKNHEGLIKAFRLAFGDDPSVQLLINYRSCHGTALDEVQALLNNCGSKNIVLTNQALDNEAYLKFFMQGDVFVSLAKGEGFSIQPREAMALGMPVVISDNTAHKTIINSGLTTAVPCPTSTPAYNPYLKCECGEEFLADIERAAAALKAIRANYDQELRVAFERRLWAAQYQFVHWKKTYLSLVKPAKITLGDKNELSEEGLTTNSVPLYQKYQKLVGKR